MLEKLVILDLSDNEVYVKNYNHSEYGDVLEFLKEHGFQEQYCSWMITSKLIINVD